GAEPAVDGAVATVQGGVGAARAVERGETGVGLGVELVERPEDDRLGGARLGAGRLHPRLEAVVAEGALAHRAGVAVEADHPEGAGADAVAAAVADVLLNEDGVVRGADDRPGRADVHAARLVAVLADVGHHQPRRAALRRRRLAELDVPPVHGVELSGVVEAVAEEVRGIAGELIPLLARDLARLAADADAGVGEEAVGRARRDRHAHVYNPMRLGMILLSPRLSACSASGIAASSSTGGTASGSLRRSMLIRKRRQLSQPSTRAWGIQSPSS